LFGLFGLQARRFALERRDGGLEDLRDLQIGVARDLHVAVLGPHDRRFVHADFGREHGLIHPGALPQLPDDVSDVPLDVPRPPEVWREQQRA